jgi:hypothetical protein
VCKADSRCCSDTWDRYAATHSLSLARWLDHLHACLPACVCCVLWRPVLSSLISVVDLACVQLVRGTSGHHMQLQLLGAVHQPVQRGLHLPRYLSHYTHAFHAHLSGTSPVCADESCCAGCIDKKQRECVCAKGRLPECCTMGTTT